jgi:hypothetical protein
MNTKASVSLVSDTVIKVCNFTFWIYPLLVLWLVFISLLPFLVFFSSTRRGSNIREISRTVQGSAINVGMWDVKNRSEDHSCINSFSRPVLPPQILRCRHFLMILPSSIWHCLIMRLQSFLYVRHPSSFLLLTNVLRSDCPRKFFPKFWMLTYVINFRVEEEFRLSFVRGTWICFVRCILRNISPMFFILTLIYSTYISVFYVFCIYFLSILCICAWLFTCAYDC